MENKQTKTPETTPATAYAEAIEQIYRDNLISKEERGEYLNNNPYKEEN